MREGLGMVRYDISKVIVDMVIVDGKVIIGILIYDVVNIVSSIVDKSGNIINEFKILL